MICVDPLREMKDEDNPRTNKIMGCFLFIDNNELWMLHTFAKMIGLSRKSFKSDCFLPRYVLTEIQRKFALRGGAKQVAFRKTVKTVRANKEKTACAAQQKRREGEKVDDKK